ncbi:hypothetical protein DYB37_002220 [Aphanomyces astaci]|uniref:Uncharacterized protein n=1 Tax=Aphanomyces astaci TaxID=112090 RepID=A0A3R7DX87_APHAT|nr:hypothetical protein DYB35_002525 [Aphanomyces astaci]RHZ23931.1 hypothetical protein DYB37_002220 [Aphanomyces astaci]
MDISIMRMEERKRHAQESDKFRAALQAEYAAKADGLADAEARLRLEFADHRQSDLFELRQTLLRELDSVRSKERQLLSSRDVEAMKHANESRRLALLEDNLKERERQLDRTLKDVQVERDGQLRRVTADAEAKVVEKSMALDALEKKLAKESQQLRDSQNEFNAMAQRVAVVDGQLAREAKATRVIHEAQVQEKAAAMHDVITQLNAANADLGRLKVAHADAIVAVKVAAYDAVTAERRAAQSAEETLRTQLTEMQARCHEVEAQCHRYQTQSEDDHVHVASLRHEIESLRAMLHTLQYAPSVSHGLGTSHVNPRDMPPMHEQDLYKQQHEHQQEREDDHARDVAAEPDKTVAAAAAQRELEPLGQHQQDAAAALKASQDTPLDQQSKAHKHAKVDMLEQRVEAKDTQDEMARRAMAEVTWQQLEDATDQLATSSHREGTDEPTESEQAEDNKPEEDTTQLRHAALEEDQVQARDGNDDHRGDGGARGYEVDVDESKRMDEKQRAMDAAVEGAAWQGQLESDRSSEVVWETHEQERRDVAARAGEAAESQDTLQAPDDTKLVARQAPDDAKLLARQQRIDDERTAIAAAAVAALENQHQLDAEIQAKQVKQRENDEAAAAAKLKAEDEATAAKLKAEEAAAAAAKMKADEEAAKLRLEQEAKAREQLKKDEEEMKAIKEREDAAAAATLDEVQNE